MAEITKNSIQNGIFQDGQLVFGSVSGDNSSIFANNNGAIAHGKTNGQNSSISAIGNGAYAGGYIVQSGGTIISSSDGAFAHGYVMNENGAIIASGVGAHAEGCETRALADGAHAEGYQTTASGVASHAEGYATDINIQNTNQKPTYVEGYSNDTHAYTYGFNRIIQNTFYDKQLILYNGLYSRIKYVEYDEDNGETFLHIEPKFPSGWKKVDNEYIYIVNRAIISAGDGAHVEGMTDNAPIYACGLGAHAEGFADIDDDRRGIASIGKGAHAEGNNTYAGGNYSHAEGCGTEASGEGAHAEGCGTEASGEGAHAEGISTQASGEGAHAGGIGTIAYKTAMTAIGQYNAVGIDINELFAVGYGSKDGNNQISRNTVFNIIGDGDPGSASLCVVNIKGEVRASGGFYDKSDIRKKDILSNISLEKSYELLDKCQEIIYVLKEDPNKKEQVGMIAQEVEEFFPEIVSTDNNGFKSLDYARLSVICLRLIKDIVEQIKELKNEIKNLKN